MPTWPSWLWPGNCSPWDEAPADRYWWPETDISIARGLEGDTKYRTRGGKHLDYEGPIWRFVSENLLLHWRIRPSELDLCNSFHSGAFLLETVPCVLNILMQHATDPEGGDHPRGQRHEGQRHHRRHRRGGRSALHGKNKLPKRWLDKLSGRTTDSDDGRIFELLALARRKWCPRCPTRPEPEAGDAIKPRWMLPSTPPWRGGGES